MPLWPRVGEEGADAASIWRAQKRERERNTRKMSKYHAKPDAVHGAEAKYSRANEKDMRRASPIGRPISRFDIPMALL